MKSDLKLLFHYLRRYWFSYLLGIVSLVTVDFVNTLIPRITGNVTDGLTNGMLDTQGVFGLAMRILLYGALIMLGRFGWRYFLFGSSRSIEREIRDDLFTHIEPLSPAWYHQHKTGDIMAHFTNDLLSVRKLLGMTVISTVDATLMLVLVLRGMIVYVSPKLTLIAVIPLILIIFGDLLFGRIMHRRFLARQEAFSELTDSVQESISGIRVIKAFVQERKQLMEFARVNARSKEKNLAVVRLMALVFPLLEFVIGIATLLTLLWGGRMAIYGEITVGQFITFNSYITLLVWPMIAAGESISSFAQGMASVHRISVILRQQPEIRDSARTDPSITALRGDIDLSHLTFTYPGASSRALEDISVHVRAGETLAIIGRTGSGKTTLLNLLTRLYDPRDPQSLRIDGHPLETIPMAVLRSSIAVVPQDSFLFSDTVERNIAFAAPADDARVRAAAEAACVHDNILQFPQQYQTSVGERGVTVSGGQKQRIAIARALYADAGILLLDDSLSAVDTNTEEEILQHLRDLRQGRTTLIAASRLSTVQDADHILVLDDGRMAEYGTHEELMALKGIYHDIYTRQQLEHELTQEGGDKDE